MQVSHKPIDQDDELARNLERAGIASRPQRFRDSTGLLSFRFFKLTTWVAAQNPLYADHRTNRAEQSRLSGVQIVEKAWVRVLIPAVGTVVVIVVVLQILSAHLSF